ncbi:MAG: DUF2797 domain-containing protein [Actinomycetota bacterium]
MTSPAVHPKPGTTNGPLVMLSSGWTDGCCVARLRAPGRPSSLVPMVGLELRYRVAEPPIRHCVGHHAPSRGDGYRDCDNPPQPTERTCVSCAVADATFAASLHHAHTRDRDQLDRDVVEHLEQANNLYLAAFRDGSIKVGTSTGRRRDTRLTEQGAWQAVSVAEVPDGFAVRRLEDLVTDKLGLPQSVAVKRKVAGMASPMAEAALTERLDRLVDEVHSLISLSPDADGATTTRTYWSFPEADSPGWDGLVPYPSRLDVGAHHVRVAAVCGRVAVLVRPDGDGSDGPDRFVADIGRLYGIELDLGDHTPDALAIQDSLF